ncbi:MAG TPA: O-antigen ligase family protein [Phycisphaerae bacterium]|nr:O-antigen ligase family protein [Phycisphaerae bacterium]
MSNLTTFNPTLLQRRPPLPVVADYAPALDEHGEVVEVNEPLMPSLLGLVTGVYLLSVVTMSSASKETSWIPQVIGATLGVLWIAVGIFAKGQPIAWSKPITLFLIFGAWAGLGFLVTIDPDYFMDVYQTSIKVSIITWICLQCIRTRKDYLICCLMIGVGGCIILLVGYDTIMRAVEFTGSRVSKGARAEDTLVNNTNDLGQVGVLMGFTSACCLLGYRSVVMKLVAIPPIIAALYIVAASGSRQAMVGVIAISVGTYWHHFRMSQKGSIGKKLIVVFLSLCVLGGTLYYIQNLPFFFRLVSVVSSREEVEREPRFQYFLYALGATAEHPLMGLGTGGFALARYGVNAENVGHYSHSTVSETLSCNGIPGFLLYFGSRFAFFFLAKRTQRLPLPSRDLAMVRLMMAFFWGLIIFDVVNITFQDRLVWPWLGVACGYLWQLNKRYGSAAPVVA